MGEDMFATTILTLELHLTWSHHLIIPKQTSALSTCGGGGVKPVEQISLQVVHVTEKYNFMNSDLLKMVETSNQQNYCTTRWFGMGDAHPMIETKRITMDEIQVY